MLKHKDLILKSEYYLFRIRKYSSGDIGITMMPHAKTWKTELSLPKEILNDFIKYAKDETGVTK